MHHQPAPYHILKLYLPVVFLLASCSVFETREAEEPDDGSGTPFIQPEQPSQVIVNLVNAVGDMNVQNYQRCITDEGFEYHPNQGSQSSDPELWSNWGFDEERDYFSNLSSSTSGLTGHQLQLENESERQDSDTELQYEADYAVTFVHDRGSDVAPTVAEGRMILYLERGDDDLWEIVEWFDFSDGSSFTWSDFRSTFIQ